MTNEERHEKETEIMESVKHKILHVLNEGQAKGLCEFQEYEDESPETYVAYTGTLRDGQSFQVGVYIDMDNSKIKVLFGSE